MRKYYSLIDKVYDMPNLERAFKQVYRNKGVAGIDGVDVESFKSNLSTELLNLQTALQTGTYQCKAVKRVYIEKRDGRQRPLGIPCVVDRVVQQALVNVLTPIFDPDFHPSSYGYRPKRSAAHAVAKAHLFAHKFGLSEVVDMDISQCFDQLDHELILQFVNRKVSDGKVLALIGQFLQSGIMEEGVFRPTEKGSPQGGVISPLLMNIYLDNFDQYMRSIGIRIVRYADDILIFARTRSKAGQYLAKARKYLEDALLLSVNEEKTHLTDIYKGINYLGFCITSRGVFIASKSLQRFKDKVRKLTPRNSGINLKQMIYKLNQLLRGFANYYRIAKSKSHLRDLMSWIRRRLRMKKMREWKNWKGLHKQLRRLGYKRSFAKISIRRWRNSSCQLVHYALPKRWFAQQGLYDMSLVMTDTLHQYYWRVIPIKNKT